MDAITQLKDDHRSVEKLFERFERAGDRAYAEKRAVVDRIIEELSVHAAVEEQLFYPVVRATVPDVEDMALESLEEHHIVKWLLDELSTLDPHDERFDAKVTVLMENVRHHVEEEESDLFPAVRDELGRAALGDLGESMAAFRPNAPTHPHPKSPDAPPLNLVTGAAAAVADRVTDTVSGAAQGTVLALQDLVALILRRKRPRRAPVGTSRARSTAIDLRDGARDLTESAIDAVKEAQQATADRVDDTRNAARATTRAAKSGAKATATSARSGAKRTATTAKRAATTTKRAATKRTASNGAATKRAASRS